MMHRLVEAINRMFEKFWVIILILLPFLLIVGLINKYFYE